MSEGQVSEWLAALTRQNEREPLGYPERLELEHKILHAFYEAKRLERRADEALHNQIESQKADWEKAISSLHQAAEEKRELEQQLVQAQNESWRLGMELAGVREEYDHALTGLANHLDALRKAQAELAQARALLERATNDDSPILAVLPETAASIEALALLREMRDLLEKGQSDA